MINIKKTNDLLLIILGVVVSFLISYFLLESLLLSILFSLFSLGLLIFIDRHKKENRLNKAKINNMCQFINMLNSQMLCSFSIYEAYKEIENDIPIDYINMSKEDMLDQLDEITKDYEFNCFKMYVNDLKIVNDNQIDFFEQVKHSTFLCLKEKDNLLKLEQKKYETLKQINYLYVLWISLLVFIKLSILDYYSLMLTQSVYQLLIFLILLIGALLYYFAYKEYLKTNYVQ